MKNMVLLFILSLILSYSYAIRVSPDIGMKNAAPEANDPIRGVVPLVKILRPDGILGGILGICQGVLLKNRYFITAGHCLFGPEYNTSDTADVDMVLELILPRKRSSRVKDLYFSNECVIQGGYGFFNNVLNDGNKFKALTDCKTAESSIVGFMPNNNAVFAITLTSTKKTISYANGSSYMIKESTEVDKMKDSRNEEIDIGIVDLGANLQLTLKGANLVSGLDIEPIGVFNSAAKSTIYSFGGREIDEDSIHESSGYTEFSYATESSFGVLQKFTFESGVLQQQVKNTKCTNSGASLPGLEVNYSSTKFNMMGGSVMAFAGDSGSPLFEKSSSDTFLLEGIETSGKNLYDNAADDHHSSYHHNYLDVSKISGWISSIIENKIDSTKTLKCYIGQKACQTHETPNSDGSLCVQP